MTYSACCIVAEKLNFFHCWDLNRCDLSSLGITERNKTFSISIAEIKWGNPDKVIQKERKYYFITRVFCG